MLIISLTLNLTLIYKLYKTIQKRDIYYNNYKQCLLALGEYDKELKKYLEKEGKLI